MQIAGRKIGADQPPYLISEISANHCGDLTQAFMLIEAAKEAGADACKVQCYEADSMTIDCDLPDFVMKDGKWKGRKLYDLYKAAQTPFSWFPDLFRHAADIGITLFSSVYSKQAVDLLEGLDCPAYKIASFEITDIPLIQHAAATGKPLIVSTGMASWEEIQEATETIDRNCALLHCVSGYPTSVEEADLGRMLDLGWNPVGLSDHSLGWEVPVAATALGAMIIEKHFTLSRSNGSEDAEFSLTPDEFKQMVKAVRGVWRAMQPSVATGEEASRQARRSLYIVEPIRRGETFTERNVRSIRPGYGISPKHLPKILGRKARMDASRGTALSLDHVDG